MEVGSARAAHDGEVAQVTAHAAPPAIALCRRVVPVIRPGARLPPAARSYTFFSPICAASRPAARRSGGRLTRLRRHHHTAGSEFIARPRLSVQHGSQVRNDASGLIGAAVVRRHTEQGVVQQRRITRGRGAVARERLLADGQPVRKGEVGRLGHVEARVEAAVVGAWLGEDKGARLGHQAEDGNSGSVQHRRREDGRLPVLQVGVPREERREGRAPRGLHRLHRVQRHAVPHLGRTGDDVIGRVEQVVLDVPAEEGVASPDVDHRVIDARDGRREAQQRRAQQRVHDTRPGACGSELAA
mmetsp:Transcript_17636/g.57739  ORF Transcript_17636/g.57739 Transcript_17636/m.57739 type:complete len:300 (-) Transcript_17636:1910-2809(-)